jgi:hypothetical protein
VKISYDPDFGLATFVGPGGFTQVQISGQRAKAIAQVLGVPYEVVAA